MILRASRLSYLGRRSPNRPGSLLDLGAGLFDRAAALVFALWRWAALVLIVTLAFLATQPESLLADEESTLVEEDDEADLPTFTGVDYVTTIIVPEETALEEDLKASSVLVREEDKPPFSRAGLSQRVRQDRTF